MRILKSIYDELMEHSYSRSFETGGILGFNPFLNAVSAIAFDENGHYSKYTYTPNSRILNGILTDWHREGIEFAGLFHTHLFNDFHLSVEDKMYFLRVIQKMPVSKVFYFPVLCIHADHKNQMMIYKAENKQHSVIIRQDQAEII